MASTRDECVGFYHGELDDDCIELMPAYEDRTTLIVLHAIASTSLTSSVLISVLNIYTLYRTKHFRHFWRRPLLERIILYMAVSDIIYSCTHMLDHLYLIVQWVLPEGPFCAILSFNMVTFSLAQIVLVLLASINAYSMTVHSRRLYLGHYDAVVFIVALVIPLILGTVAAGSGLFGPQPYW